MAQQLFSQPYAPNVRAISGVNNSVFPDDCVINCDTSGGAVALELATIPTNWSMTYHLLVVDIGNNAAINNITINAPAGCIINGQNSITINGNGGSFYITVANNSSYVGLYGGIVNAPSPGLIYVTYAQLQTLVANNGILDGQFYWILDVANVNFLAGEGVIVQGVKNNTATSVQGTGYFLNADYRNIGNYTGTPIPFLNTRGIWFQGVAPAGTGVGTVVIWNNNHYITPTGTWWNGVVGSNPATDAVNWTLMPRTSPNVGYLRVADTVKYRFSTNRVVYRADDLGNEVDDYTFGAINSLQYFQWGRPSGVNNNKVRANSYFDCRNSNANYNGNTLENGRIADQTPSNISPVPTVSRNIITATSILTITENRGTLLDNVLSGNATIDITLNTGLISQNTISNAGQLVIETSTGSPTFSNNQISQVRATYRNLQGTTTNKVAGAGLSTFTGVLDCSIQPAVYNPIAPKTLTLDATYDAHIGIFAIINLPDNIDRIVNLSTLFPTSFSLSGFPVQVPRPLTLQNVAVAAPNDIICTEVLTSLGNPPIPTFATLTLTPRANFNDIVTMIKSGSLNVITSVVRPA